MYITDIHEPTIANSLFNAKLNATANPHAETSAAVAAEDDGVVEYLHPASESSPASSTAVRVLNVNWKDASTFPAERADVLLGSDLVYDSSILAILVPAVDRMMTQGQQLMDINLAQQQSIYDFISQMDACCMWLQTLVATACLS